MSVPSAPVLLRVGDALPPAPAIRVTRTDIVRYAGAAGDFNPIHHDEDVARDAGLPGVFGMGLLHGGMLGLALARWVGPDNIRAYAVRYSARVWPGDALSFAGTVVAVDPAGVADVALQVTRQTGEVALRATATVVVAASPAP